MTVEDNQYKIKRCIATAEFDELTTSEIANETGLTKQQVTYAINKTDEIAKSERSEGTTVNLYKLAED